ncbi:MAG: hypothetical protein QM765_41425 [Myxococcales bacterium]
MKPGLVVSLAVLALAASAQAAQKKPKAAPPPPPPAASPLEKTFVQGEEAERVWGVECPLRESVAVDETKLLDLGVAKVLSEESPVAVVAAEKTGKLKVTGVGPGLTILRLQKKKGEQQLVCLRVTAPAPMDLPSPGPCVVPKGAAAMLIQSAGLPLGARALLPMPGWKRFSVDSTTIAKVAGTGPDELALEGLQAGKTQLRVCQGAKVQIINLEVEAAPP